MLDINLFRTGEWAAANGRGLDCRSIVLIVSGADKGGDPELVRESQRRRFKDVSQVDQVIELDAEWRSVRYELDNFQKELNSISKEVGQIKKVIRGRSFVHGLHALCTNFAMRSWAHVAGLTETPCHA